MATQKDATETPQTQPSKDKADSLVAVGKVLVKIGEIIKPLNDEERRLVVKQVAAAYAIDLNSGN